ncbi:hypothetical protein CL629_04645 [bacterium]|nr:hypothetical protein [bacterium]|tara:strand:+ start:2782 stop:3015 length:234 start_codon:yes stop_codon:yes gene_type:complete
MEDMLFKGIGVIGLVLITIGIIVGRRKTQSFLFIIGGLCLGAYSIYIRDVIFIILQIVFTLVAIYEFIKLQFGAHKK